MLIISLIILAVLMYIYKRRSRYHSKVILPWFKMHKDDKAVARLHCFSLRSLRKANTLRTIEYIIIWPALSLFHSCKQLCKNGRYVSSHYNVGVFRQLYHLMYLALIHNLSAECYYLYKLWSANNLQKADLYIQNFECRALVSKIHSNVDVNDIDNKLLFFKACQQYGLATAPVVAAIKNDGGIEWLQEQEVLPPQDLLIKPVNEACGNGIEKWIYDQHGKWKRNEDQALNDKELLEYCRNYSSDSACIIQLVLKNHSELMSYSRGGLATVRVVTGILPTESPIVLMASFRMPVGKSFLDNFHAGGIAAGISNKGLMTAAITMNIADGEYFNHPDTKATIKGEALPHYDKIIRLALDAQRVFNRFYFVGWDIALTEDGPILIEANTNWDTEIVQATNSIPLGESKFTDIMEQLVIKQTR